MESWSPKQVCQRLPYHLLSEDGLDLIDRATDRILKDIGIEFRGDAAALALWRQAGADVQGEQHGSAVVEVIDHLTEPVPQPLERQIVQELPPP